mmetsp:Transcript_51411/g.129784  ORF Transcript_51411/g.129784 Transcript_51411/m.129784 type:complete len:101 (+) Transcript_51411:374-676(+)
MDGSTGAPAAKAKACAASTSLPWDSISSCFGGSQGDDLLAKAAKHFDTRFPQAVGVPRVEVNGKEVQEHTYSAVLKAVCATGIQAAACASSSEPRLVLVV